MLIGFIQNTDFYIITLASNKFQQPKHFQIDLHTVLKIICVYFLIILSCLKYLIGILVLRISEINEIHNLFVIYKWFLTMKLKLKTFSNAYLLYFEIYVVLFLNAISRKRFFIESYNLLRLLRVLSLVSVVRNWWEYS